MGNAPVNPQPRPVGPPVMYQNWRRLLFLHWIRDVGEVQRTLPPGLTVDLWEGRAWLGIVPFRMEGVRPRFCPPVPGLSNFLELNVRTYVRDARGRPGVWFYSLDCAQPLAVWTARAAFGLPYFSARMRERIDDWISCDCRRPGARETARYAYRGAGNPERAGEGTLEQFLIERYRLFSARHGRLATGEVWHEPYWLQRAEVARWSGAPLRQAGFDIADATPDHMIFSSGVDTRIFRIAPA
ncbi:MAG: DUF2071 domain-containing protein [Terrimicrobiaceae bacterium]|nr:DUF2071 domain-containing protein [Terrimicrobiaceae bacterium]